MKVNRLSKKKVGVGIGIVVVATAATLGFAFRSQHKNGTHVDQLEAARARLEADCSRWKAQHGGADHAAVCDVDRAPRRLEFKEPYAKVKTAREKLDVGDETGAVRDLRYALDGAAELDRAGTPIAAMMAAKIVSDALDLIEPTTTTTTTSRARFSQANIASLLYGRRLTSSAHPLEGERLFHLSAIASKPALLPLPARPFASIHAARSMAEEDSVTSSMEYAIRMRDKDACVEASNKRDLTRSSAMYSDLLCTKLIAVIHTSRRLDRLRNNASEQSLRGVRPPNTGQAI